MGMDGDAVSGSEERPAEAGAALEADREHLLAGYDRVRERVARALARDRDGGGAVTEMLLAVPDVFMLLVRLVLDREVPGKTRAVVGSALAYFVLPTDLLPEALIGGLGYAEDVVLATAILAHSFGADLERFAGRHWSGTGEMREALGRISASARRLMGPRLEKKLGRALGRRGVAGF